MDAGGDAIGDDEGFVGDLVSGAKSRHQADDAPILLVAVQVDSESKDLKAVYHKTVSRGSFQALSTWV
jgi:hypothetical protein